MLALHAALELTPQTGQLSNCALAIHVITVLQVQDFTGGFMGKFDSANDW